MKHLFEIPAEILDKVFYILVQHEGVHIAVRKKRTCRSFNRRISQAIWSTRALDTLTASDQYGSKSKYLFVDYLVHRTRADRLQRYYRVTEIIYETIDYLKQNFDSYLDPSLDYLQEACLAIVCAKEDTLLTRHNRSTRFHEALHQPTESYTVQENVLALAAFLGLLSVVKKLVEDGIRDRPTCFGSPLICVAKHLDTSMADYYLRARLKIRERCGPTFRTTSCICTRRRIVATFQKSHQRDISSEMYAEAIAAATMYGRPETVEALLEASLHDAETSAHIPPQPFADDIDSRLELLPDRWTYLLIYAIQCGKPDVVQLALNHGANPNTRCPIVIDCYSAMGTAAEHGETAIFQQLLRQGGDLRYALEVDGCFLNKVVLGGSLEIARLCFDAGLIDMPVSPSWMAAPQHRPLCTAVAFNRPEMVRFILATGSGFGTHPDAESFVTRYAKDVGNQEIIDLLDAFRRGESISERATGVIC